MNTAQGVFSELKKNPNKQKKTKQLFDKLGAHVAAVKRLKLEMDKPV